MNDQIFSQQIFFEPQSSFFAGEEASFLDISEMFGEPVRQNSNYPFLMVDSPPPFLDQFQQTPPREETCMSVVADEEKEQPVSKPKKPMYKSSYNKNVCYNICQKTVKVIKKGTYEQKVSELCKAYGGEVEKFKELINRRKREFTGPKALSSFAAEKSALNQVFVAFMKWFLTEKYLRIALNEGEMKDIKAYIEYKNLVILPLLQ